MRGVLLYLLLAFVLGLGGAATIGVCAEASPPLQLAAPMIEGQQQGVVALHDIRGPVELPDSSGLLFWLLIALAVVIIAGLLFYFWKRRKKGEIQPQPHEIALTELARLRTMMNPEQALLYAAQLSEILRRYVEARFQLHSTRQTTREFFADLGLNPQAVRSMAAHHDRLKECLEQCDMAKFAHCIPGQPEMEAMEEAVRFFIRATGQTVAQRGQR
ncbi:MAG: DUF4381 family protein [Desulfoarculaceae bacterium]|nr:DUF4381 family protein [Desulfoarculaceae bacterium]